MKGLFVGQQRSGCDLHPNGVIEYSPGSHASCAPWDGDVSNHRNPNGVTEWNGAPVMGNPVGVHVYDQLVTQGALADSRPWAKVGNPVGVQKNQFHGDSAKESSHE